MGRRRRRGSGPPGWAVAKSVLSTVVRERGIDPRSVDFGRVRFLGEGVSYRTWSALTPWAADDDPDDEGLVVRVPRRPVEPDQRARAEREHELLRRLNELDLEWRIPRPVACVPLEEGVAQVLTLVRGRQVSDCHGLEGEEAPWTVIARAAALCHSVDPSVVRDVLPGAKTRREHAERQLEPLAGSDLPELRDAYAWAREHLPPLTPARLLHGDLLPQNLHLDLFEGLPVGVIDWSEAELGDPAFDLAVVTRGSPKPLKQADGFQRLLEAYNACAAEPLAAHEIRLHELCMLGCWYLEAEHEERSRLNQLRNVLKRAQSERG